MIARFALAAVVALVGLIFIGQGLGYIGGSGMSNQPFWALVGAVMIVAAGLLVWRASRSR